MYAMMCLPCDKKYFHNILKILLLSSVMPASVYEDIYGAFIETVAG